MPERRDIDRILQDWPYEPGALSARLVRAQDGREIVQMRVEMGVLQMETTGRPDGARPEGFDTLLDALIQQSLCETERFGLTEQQCVEVDREFLQFYHRRICWLALRDFGRAVRDADHTLALMDFSAQHSPDPQWSLAHEQYRPFVLFHRTQAAAMAKLQEAGPENAIEEIDRGLQRIRDALVVADHREQLDGDELVAQLHEMKQSLRQEYHVGPTLTEQLTEAVANEEYERAAKLRDQIARHPHRR